MPKHRWTCYDHLLDIAGFHSDGITYQTPLMFPLQSRALNCSHPTKFLTSFWQVFDYFDGFRLHNGSYEGSVKRSVSTDFTNTEDISYTESKNWPNFCRHKIYLSPVELGIIARARRCLKPFQILTFEDESCNGWYPAFHFSRHLIGSLKQPEAVKLIKVIKNLSKRCQKPTLLGDYGWRRLTVSANSSKNTKTPFYSCVRSWQSFELGLG